VGDQVNGGGLEKPLRPNRPIIGLLAVAAMMLGLTPAVLALHLLWLLLYLFIGSVVVVGLTVRGLRAPSPTRATIPEFLLAGLNAAMVPALLGLTWLGLYHLTALVVRLISRASGVDGDARFIALALSLTIAAIMGVTFAWYVAQDLGAALYPEWGGNRTKFFYMTLQPRATLNVSIAVGVLVVGLIVAALISSSWTSTAVWVVLLVWLFYAGAAAEPVMSPSKSYDPRTEDVQAVGEALIGQGYRVVAYPRTGKPDIDPLVRKLELFSYSDERAYAVDIKHGLPDAEPLDWTAGAGVLDAAQALERAQLTETSAEIQPLLVILDAQTQESLRRFCQGEGVSLIHVERATGRSETVGHDESDLQAIVRRYLVPAEMSAKSEGTARGEGRQVEGGPADAHLG
jgi:hypothetical protein